MTGGVYLCEGAQFIWYGLVLQSYIRAPRGENAYSTWYGCWSIRVQGGCHSHRQSRPRCLEGRVQAKPRPALRAVLTSTLNMWCDWEASEPGKRKDSRYMQHEPLPPFIATRCLSQLLSSSPICCHTSWIAQCAFLDTINQWFSTLISKACSVSGHKYNVYACLVCEVLQVWLYTGIYACTAEGHPSL